MEVFDSISFSLSFLLSTGDTDSLSFNRLHLRISNRFPAARADDGCKDPCHLRWFKGNLCNREEICFGRRMRFKHFKRMYTRGFIQRLCLQCVPSFRIADKKNSSKPEVPTHANHH